MNHNSRPIAPLFSAPGAVTVSSRDIADIRGKNPTHEPASKYMNTALFPLKVCNTAEITQNGNQCGNTAKNTRPSAIPVFCQHLMVIQRGPVCHWSIMDGNSRTPTKMSILYCLTNVCVTSSCIGITTSLYHLKLSIRQPNSTTTIRSTAHTVLRKRIQKS